MASTGVSHEGPARAHPEAATADATAHADHVPGKSHFWRHFVEMTVAMVVGMAVLGMPFRAILASFGYTWDEASARFPEIVCAAMTFNMAVGMVAWMRYRGHGWRTTTEMTLAMCAATAVALGMFWLHIVSEDPLIGLMHVLMLPAMLIAMLSRREEYSYAHR
jgi:flagellar biosynthetic protein FliP